MSKNKQLPKADLSLKSPVCVMSAVLLLSTSCGTIENGRKMDQQEVLMATWIYVDEELIHPETASQFFPKINSLIRETHPSSKVDIYIASEFLPHLVTDRNCDTTDPFARTLQEIREKNANVSSPGRMIPVYDVLKLFCDVTGTRMVIEKDKVLIAPKE